MNDKNNFGEIKKIDIKSIWKNEQFDFTPWLSEEENIKKLSYELGIEMEIEGVEVEVGPYSADILAKDSFGKYVVVENQYGKTNHDHLGKLITYGSFLGAGSLIWVAEYFTEEHQKALDWLNDNTTEELYFYGVALEVIQIDNSRPALRFNVVSRPTVSKQAYIAKTTSQDSDAKKIQLAFWEMFREKLLSEKVVSSTQTPRAQYWFDVPLGKSGIYLSNIVNTAENRIGIRVYIALENSDRIMNYLLEHKGNIEKQIVAELQWNPNPDNKHKTIGLYRNVELDRKENWPEYCEWMVQQVKKFREVFGPIVKKINISD